MKQSDSIVKLSAALVSVQEHITPIAKDRENSHFKNKYATLDAIMESIRAPLASVGLAIVQGGGAPVSNVDGVIVGVGVETMLVHSSGEYVSSVITLPITQASPQAVGSAVTYGRRYGVASLLALTTEEDDDGNHATASTQNRVAAPSRVAAPARVLSKDDVVKALDMEPAEPDHRNITDEEGRPVIGGQAEESCPKCTGPMWDNRVGKKNPKAPDFKCKDRSCDGVIWPPKAQKAKAAPGREMVSLSDYAPPHTDDDSLPFN